MSDVTAWSTVASENQQIAPESSMRIPQLNDAIRILQAAMRSMLNELPWIAYGNMKGPATITVDSPTRFHFPAPYDLSTSTYMKGRMIKVAGANNGAKTGIISASQYTNGGNQVLDMEWPGNPGGISQEAGIQLWCFIMTPEWMPFFNLSSGQSIAIGDGGGTRIGLDSSGLQFFVQNILLATFATDGILVGSNSRSERQPGSRLYRNGAVQITTEDDVPMRLAREVGTGNTNPTLMQGMYRGAVLGGQMRVDNASNVKFIDGTT